MNIKTVEDLKNFIKDYDDIRDFLENYLSTFDDNRDFFRLTKRLDPNERYIRIRTYETFFLIPKLLRMYWKDFTKRKVDKAMIFQSGRHFEDGFSGIQVKKLSYQDGYIVSIEDGENNLMTKFYEDFPNYDRLLFDSIFSWLLSNDEKTYKPSLLDLFNKES